VDVDPLASMQCWAIDVELGGRVFQIPALPAADWWPVLAGGDLSKILDFLMSDDDLDQLLITGEVGGKQLSQALTDVIEEVAGRSFHAALVLTIVAQNQWPLVSGNLAQRGFRWDVMPLGAALDAIYAMVVTNMEDEPRRKFIALLDNEALTSRGKRPSTRQRAAVVTEFETLAGPKPTAGLTATAELSGSARPKTRRQPQQPLPDAP
jgi:hypothetical protein